MPPAAARRLSPPLALVSLALLLLLLPPPPHQSAATGHPLDELIDDGEKHAETTDIPEEEMERFAQLCMEEVNTTHDELETAYDKDPNQIPRVIKCLLSCMYRQQGLLVDGELSVGNLSNVMGVGKEYTALVQNCKEKVSSTTDVCEKGVALRDCLMPLTASAVDTTPYD